MARIQLNLDVVARIFDFLVDDLDQAYRPDAPWANEDRKYLASLRAGHSVFDRVAGNGSLRIWQSRLQQGWGEPTELAIEQPGRNQLLDRALLTKGAELVCSADVDSDLLVLEYTAVLSDPPRRLRLIDLHKARIEFLSRWPRNERLACYETVAESDLPALEKLCL